MSKPVLSIGWDVGGWQGRKQGIAAVSYTVGDDVPIWLEYPTSFKFKEGQTLGLQSLLEPLQGSISKHQLDQYERIIVAIDAPLAFPKAFVTHLTSSESIPRPPKSEIENRLAYRSCERWVESEFRKPLSASFDKLGNNTTLAIAMARALRLEGFSIEPFDNRIGPRVAIEVYPGLSKVGRKKSDEAARFIHDFIPKDIECGTDEYDAAICALTGLSFAGFASSLGINQVISPPANELGAAREEGWIYVLPG